MASVAFFVLVYVQTTLPPPCGIVIVAVCALVVAEPPSLPVHDRLVKFHVDDGPSSVTWYTPGRTFGNVTCAVPVEVVRVNGLLAGGKLLLPISFVKLNVSSPPTVFLIIWMLPPTSIGTSKPEQLHFDVVPGVVPNR